MIRKKMFFVLIMFATVLALISCGDKGETALSTPAPVIDVPAQSTPHITVSETEVIFETNTPQPTESVSPMQTETPSPTPTPTDTPEPVQTEKLPLSGFVIGIDPGHQLHGNHDTEPCAPGSDVMKAKVSSGTEGIFTHTPEYQVNLDVGLLLRDILEDMGARVIMTRTTNDVDISNIERAQIFNKNKTDYAIRLHCNGTDDTSVHGAFMLVPTENPYVDDCNRAAELLIKAFCKETGAKNLGITHRDDQTGFNWCDRMIINIEMGHMSNKEEDILLSDSDYQKKMARGIADGIVEYFKK